MPARSIEDIVQQFKVTPGKTLKLKDHDPGWSGDDDVPKAERKQFAKSLLSEDITEPGRGPGTALRLEQVVRAGRPPGHGCRRQGRHDQARHVRRQPAGLPGHSASSSPPPRSSTTTSSGATSRALPERGRMGIFNRSYYEEVLVVRVHPEWIQTQRIPGADPADPKFWEARYRGHQPLRAATWPATAP